MHAMRQSVFLRTFGTFYSTESSLASCEHVSLHGCLVLLPEDQYTLTLWQVCFDKLKDVILLVKHRLIVNIIKQNNTE